MNSLIKRRFFCSVSRWLRTLLVTISVFLFAATASASYHANINTAVDWLVQQQHADGSWGAKHHEKRLLTSEAVDALGASGYRQLAYYKGITWLENHSSTNIDFLVRRARVLNTHGDATTEHMLTVLDAAQNLARPAKSGWGSSPAYIESPVDTALVLQGLFEFGASAGNVSVNVQAALNYLKSAQLAGNGWPLSLGNASDPWSTALIVKALSLWLAQDAELSIPVTQGLAALDALVTTASPEYLQALASQAALAANDFTSASYRLDELAAKQLANGSWSGQIYDTALALRAMASANGNDSLANQTTVTMPDARLRMAVNAALGRNAQDALNCIELAQLTELVAVAMDISDLTGLECATNLTLLNLSNNKITSVTAIEHLLSSAIILLEGNPAEGLVPVLNIPLPMWMYTALLVVLLLTARVSYKNKVLVLLRVRD